MNLEKKVSIITGGGGGIGRAVCLAFAREGSDVQVVDIDGHKAQAVSEEVKALGRESFPFEIDVSQQCQVKEMVRMGLGTFGKVDVLVNVAGIIRGNSSIEDVSEEDWDRVIGVNLKGTFLCSQAVGKEMMKLGGGSIINFASIAGHSPQINAGAYSPSKAGVISLTKLMAVEWAKHAIRVNAVSPGPIRTPMLESVLNTEGIRKRAKTIPLNRIGNPEEVANAVVFLASDSSSFVTGHAFVIDGGSLNSAHYLSGLLSG